MLFERWEEVAGVPEVWVSDLGRLRGIHGRTGRRVYYRLQEDRDGYLRCVVKREGRRYVVRVHREVARAFLGPCPEGLEVNHINGDKADARVGNLEYLTHAENLKHAYRELGVKVIDHGTPVDVWHVLRAHEAGMSNALIARMVGRSRTTVRKVLRGELN